jgi:hypothetical protein
MMSLDEALDILRTDELVDYGSGSPADTDADSYDSDEDDVQADLSAALILLEDCASLLEEYLVKKGVYTGKELVDRRKRTQEMALEVRGFVEQWNVDGTEDNEITCY